MSFEVFAVSEPRLGLCAPGGCSQSAVVSGAHQVTFGAGLGRWGALFGPGALCRPRVGSAFTELAAAGASAVGRRGRADWTLAGHAPAIVSPAGQLSAVPAEQRAGSAAAAAAADC